MLLYKRTLWLTNWSPATGHFGICEIWVIVMSKLREEEAHDLSGDGTTSSMILLRYSASQQTFHPLNLQKLWAINSLCFGW
jgi:hypothetical protein